MLTGVDVSTLMSLLLSSPTAEPQRASAPTERSEDNQDGQLCLTRWISAGQHSTLNYQLSTNYISSVSPQFIGNTGVLYYEQLDSQTVSWQTISTCGDDSRVIVVAGELELWGCLVQGRCHHPSSSVAA